MYPIFQRVILPLLTPFRVDIIEYSMSKLYLFDLAPPADSTKAPVTTHALMLSTGTRHGTHAVPD